MLAYTGLETVANLAEETREPGRALPRSLFSAIGLVVVVTVLIAAIGLSAYPATGGETALGEEWLEAPLVGIAAAFDGELPWRWSTRCASRSASPARSSCRRGATTSVSGHHAPDATRWPSTARFRASSPASSAGRSSRARRS